MPRFKSSPRLSARGAYSGGIARTLFGMAARMISGDVLNFL
jgi:hypothetical protein